MASPSRLVFLPNMKLGALSLCDWTCVPTEDLRLYTGPGEALPMWSASALRERNTLRMLSLVDVPKPKEGCVGFVDRYCRSRRRRRRIRMVCVRERGEGAIGVTSVGRFLGKGVTGWWIVGAACVAGRGSRVKVP